MFADTGQENRRRAGARPEYNVSVGGGVEPRAWRARESRGRVPGQGAKPP